MNLSRLIIARDYVRDNVPDERFDLNSWAGNKSIPFQGHEDLSCGTVACFCGWAATIPEFRKLGFRLMRNIEDSATIVYQRHYSWEAIAYFFGIPKDDAVRLFDRSYYETGSRQEVLKAVSKYIENNHSL